MNIFITGASGFIGKHLVKALTRDHHLYTPSRFFFSDIDDEGLARFMSYNEIDVVIHLATYFVRRNVASDVIPLIETNIELGTRILEAIRSRTQTWFINTGTAWQNTGPNYDQPYNLYAETKSTFQSILSTYPNPNVTLKIFETYGPGDSRDKVLNLIHAAAVRNDPLKLSPGEQELELTYIEDVIRPYLRILELIQGPSKLDRNEFGIRGDRLNLRALVATYENATGRKVKARWGELPYRQNEIMIPFRNYQSVPGIVPSVSLKEGIRKTFLEATESC